MGKKKGSVKKKKKKANMKIGNSEKENKLLNKEARCFYQWVLKTKQINVLLIIYVLLLTK